jgi:hypothetical protein
VRRGMWDFVPHLPLHRWSSVLQLTTLPSSAAARASLFCPRHGSGRRRLGMEMKSKPDPFSGCLDPFRDPRAHVPSDPALISLGPSRQAIPYRSRSAAEGFLGPHDLHTASRLLFFFHPQRRGLSRDNEALRHERSFFLSGRP